MTLAQIIDRCRELRAQLEGANPDALTAAEREELRELHRVLQALLRLCRS